MSSTPTVLVTGARRFLGRRVIPFEATDRFVAVDAGSTDSSPKLLHEHGVQGLDQTSLGHGERFVLPLPVFEKRPTQSSSSRLTGTRTCKISPVFAHTWNPEPTLSLPPE